MKPRDLIKDAGRQLSRKKMFKIGVSLGGKYISHEEKCISQEVGNIGHLIITMCKQKFSIYHLKFLFLY